ncbi:hypothetical protein [Algoriphagus terrigena]|uniref:hypothetical protein n=1 Tax=Algoriphagus terrigena TaxID=344884 RepID=UPI0003FEB7DD|nr:hypothetical protein [Algoriphagus terrigena]
MKYRVNISNLSFDIELEKLEDLPASVSSRVATAIAAALPADLGPELSQAVSKGKYVTLEEFDYDWEKAVQHTQTSDVSIILLQPGKKYHIKEYRRQKLKKDLFIISKGNSELVFGIDYFDQWHTQNGIKQDRFIFDLGDWNAKIGIINVDVNGAKMVDEVQPFYRTLFINSVSANQSGAVGLINSTTNLEFGLLYSGSLDRPLTLVQKNVNFKGIIWQELKANNGGGLSVIMESCDLNQIDPPVYFKKNVSFSANEVRLGSGSFYQIENIFQGAGNSCNIVYVEGMTFILPPRTFIQNYHNRFNGGAILETNRDSAHYIHTIPRVGEKFLMSRSYNQSTEPIPDMLRNVINWEKLGIPPQKNTVRALQAGDRLKIDGQSYLIKITDRVVGVAFASEYRHRDQDSYYSQEFKLDRSLPVNLPMVFEVEVLASKGEKLLDGASREGFIIFKYNKNWQTNVDVDHGLDYMLASNPFGVLSYNHKEISVWAKNTKHNGFYRQSKSGVGQSKGYTLINSSGFADQFDPEDEVRSDGEMPAEARNFITFLEEIVVNC